MTSSSSSSSSSALDVNGKEERFAAWFASLERTRNDGSKILCLLQRGNAGGQYYTAHGADAEAIADEYFSTRDDIKRMGALPYININLQRFQSIVRDALLKKRQCVNIYTRNAATDTWSLLHEATPGSYACFDFMVLDVEQENPIVMSLTMGAKIQGQPCVGISFLDATGHHLEACEIVDDIKFSNFRAIVTQKNIREVLVAGATLKKELRLAAVLNDSNIPVTTVEPSLFSSTNTSQDIKRLVGSTHQHFNLLDLAAAMKALSCLIKHGRLLQDESWHGKYTLRSYDMARYMKLDKAAVEALNLFPVASDSNKNMSLFGLLNKGKTAQGTRLLGQWIRQPLVDQASLNRRLDLVEMLAQDTDLRSSLLGDHLVSIPDLERTLLAFQKKSAAGGLERLVGLYQFLLKLPGLSAALDAYSGPHRALLDSDFIEPLTTCRSNLHQLEAMVEQTVDLDALKRREYVVNPAFNAQLTKLKRSKDRLLQKMEIIHNEVADELGIDAGRVKLNTVAMHGYHLRVTRKDEKFIRGSTHFQTIETRKDGVRFTTMELKRLSRSFQEMAKEYESAQEEIVLKCLEIVLSYSPVFERLGELLSELDVLAAFANIAVSSPTPYCRPALLPMGSGTMVFKNARHPCIEAQDDVDFIPNDVEMKKGESTVQIITGPNMGGKSSYIRQVGVIVLMAQIGCFVPCDEASVTIVDCVLARVGAGDSQLKGVSTFMKEMLEASLIIKTATPNSLVIIDELGRGTSTYDGFGLAWAIAEHCAKELDAFTMFATHFHEITALAEQVPSVVNKHVTAHTTDHSITMLYKVMDGECDRSFGIHVSELAKFPASVVAMAKRKAADLETYASAGGSGGAKKQKQLRTPTSVDGKSFSAASRALVDEFCAIPLKGDNQEDIQPALSALSEKLQAFLAEQQ